MQILEELYYGGIQPNERSIKKDGQYAKALRELVQAGEVLTSSLNPEQREHFDQYVATQLEADCLTDVTTFCQAFKLGARIMLEVLAEGELKEI